MPDERAYESVAGYFGESQIILLLHPGLKAGNTPYFNLQMALLAIDISLQVYWRYSMQVRTGNRVCKQIITDTK